MAWSGHVKEDASGDLAESAAKDFRILLRVVVRRLAAFMLSDATFSRRSVLFAMNGVYEINTDKSSCF